MFALNLYMSQHIMKSESLLKIWGLEVVSVQVMNLDSASVSTMVIYLQIKVDRKAGVDGIPCYRIREELRKNRPCCPKRYCRYTC